VAEGLRANRAGAALRVVAALGGTLPAAVLAAICAARFLPLGEEARVVIGLTLAIPLWLTAICLTSLVRTGRWAWLWCVGAAAVLAVLGLGIRH
jgi:hypothetical protein